MFVYFKHAIVILLVGISISQKVVAEIPSCFFQIEQEFFNPTYVTQAISSNRRIAQSSWSVINQQLQKNVQSIPSIVSQRAEKMHPNPLSPRFLPLEAEKLLNDVQFEVLARTLLPFQVTNPHEIRDILNYLRSKMAKKWSSCFEKPIEDKQIQKF